MVLLGAAGCTRAPASGAYSSTPGPHSSEASTVQAAGVDSRRDVIAPSTDSANSTGEAASATQTVPVAALPPTVGNASYFVQSPASTERHDQFSKFLLAFDQQANKLFAIAFTSDTGQELGIRLQSDDAGPPLQRVSDVGIMFPTPGTTDSSTVYTFTFDHPADFLLLDVGGDQHVGAQNGQFECVVERPATESFDIGCRRLEQATTPDDSFVDGVSLSLHFDVTTVPPSTLSADLSGTGHIASFGGHIDLTRG